MNKLIFRVFLLLHKLKIWIYRGISKNIPNQWPICLQALQLVGNGSICFGNQVKIGVFPSPYFFSTYSYIEARNESASISIGKNTWINNNFCAVAEHTNITIGDDCLIGTHVEIYDSDFHGLAVADRRKSLHEWAKPVVIENDVFIGSNVKILKGVRVGAGAVIANSAVVVSDVAPGTVVAGIPAKYICMAGEQA